MSPSSPAPTIRIAGVGLTTPLGRNAWETFSALLEGRTLASRAPNLPSGVTDVDFVRALGCVAIAQQDPVDPAIALAEAAAREAATMAGVTLQGLPTWLGSSKGCVAAATPNSLRPLLVRPADPCDPETGETMPLADARTWVTREGLAEALILGPHATLSRYLARRTGIAPVSHHVAACASSLTALHHAAEYLRRLPEPATGESVSCLVVTAEASLLPAFIASYRKLGVLAPIDIDSYRQSPLADFRQGFMLAETGAAVVLTRCPSDTPPTNAQLGDTTLVDSAIATEASDLIRPSQEMPALRHIAQRLFGGRQIDCLHTHSPGTAEHDPAELQALADVINAEREMTQSHDSIDLYACKGALGHALGASGLTALTIATLCLATGKRPPMPWLQENDQTKIMQPCAMPVTPQATSLSRQGSHAIFASGFAGHTAGALIKRA